MYSSKDNDIKTEAYLPFIIFNKYFNEVHPENW